MSKKLILSAAICSTLVATALTGCTPGGLPGSAAPGSSTNSAATPSSNGGAAGAGFTLPKTCPSAADVASTLGVAAYGPTASGDSTSLVCEYLTASKDGPIIDFEPARQLTKSDFVSTMTAQATSGSTVTPVSGIGDAAVLLHLSNGHVIYVLAGKLTIDIAGLSASDAALEAMAKKVLAN